MSGQAAWGFSKLSEGWGTEMVKTQEEDTCEEKRLYYRVISGAWCVGDTVPLATPTR